jgi:hypothetical protein
MPVIDFFDVAVRAARQQAARVQPLTHWNTYDAPMHRGTQQTACGEYVSLRQFSVEPTCPACRQQQAIYNAMEF